MSYRAVIELSFDPAAPEFRFRLVSKNRFGAEKKEKVDGENQLQAQSQLRCYYQHAASHEVKCQALVV